jgi:hypothetical protein
MDASVGTVDCVRAVPNSRVSKVGRILSAAVFSAVAFSGLAISSAGATSTGLSCIAIVLNRPHPYSVVTINVSTRPNAAVSGTESAAGHSWSMTPSASANSAGTARLSQKIPAVRKYELVRVTVHVTLNGATGSCKTRYSPPTLVAQT